MIKNITNNDIKVNYIGLVITYLLVPFSLYYFIIKEKKSVEDAFILGLCIYGVFDFTNLSVLDKYELNFAVIDTLYGGTMFAFITYLLK
jgi:uncharacterized membrane protein